MSIKKRGTKTQLKGSYTDVKITVLDDLIPYDKNPKRHPQEQVEKIANSIKSFGFDQPIVVDSDMVIIKGHGRRLASQYLGLKRVPVIVRTDMTAAQVRASRIADNQTAESYYDMSNLIYELETLYSLGGDDSLESTGFEHEEIKTLLPGLLDTVEDMKVSDIEGTIPIEQSMVGPDNLMGSKLQSDLSPVEYLKQHDGEIVILFNGNRTDLSVICWAIQNGIKPESLLIIDFSFGQRMWKWHRDYLNYVEEKLGVTVLSSGISETSKFTDSIKEKGFPSENTPFCCNIYKPKALTHNIQDKENALILFGGTKTEDGEQLLRTKGKLINTDLKYIAPFAADSPDKTMEVIQESDVELNPLYKRTDSYLCPGCPMYKSPDYTMLREIDLDLWIRWTLYMGRAQHNSEAMREGYLNDQLLRMIGDGIEPRKHGKFADFAQEIPNCVQPVRRQVRAGDNYGWSEEEDKDLPESDRLDQIREQWWENEEFSKAYTALTDECTQVQSSIEKLGLDEHLKQSVKKAKEVANTTKDNTTEGV